MGCASSIHVQPMSMRDMIVQYISIEKQVRLIEKGRVFDILKIKKEQYQDLNENIREMSVYHGKCLQNVAKEKHDVEMAGFQTVKNFFKEGQSLVEKEQQEYLDACNTIELAESELTQLKAQVPILCREIESLEISVSTLESLYNQQDNILVNIFQGSYGSELENIIESQMDAVIARRQIIEQAQYRWANGSILVQYVNQQLDVSISLWKTIVSPEKCDMQWRYLVATKTRDNLLAAYTNLQTCHQQIGQSVEFPYCNKNELAELMIYIRNIYSDMQSKASHEKALSVYWATRQRSSALLQWFQHVINSSIKPDLENILQEVKQKKKDLRVERLRLLKEKMVIHGITDLQLMDEEEDNSDQQVIEEMLSESDVNQSFYKTPMIQALNRHPSNIKETKILDKNKRTLALRQKMKDISGLTKSSGSEEDFRQLVMAIMAKEARVVEPPQKEETIKIDMEEVTCPEEIATVDLAPLPKQRDLFGDIEDLRRKHEQEIEELQKVQEMDKYRQEQNLKRKLENRRNHKDRTTNLAK